jgi:hypothetical protein
MLLKKHFKISSFLLYDILKIIIPMFYSKNLNSAILKFTLLFLLFFISLRLDAQTPNIFSSPDAIKNYLDGKTYIIPEYGIIKFEFNNSDTKKMRESRIKDGADDELVDLIFDVSIKRNQSKKRDKTGYKIEMKINLSDEDSDDGDPTESYFNYFFLARNVIYPIKKFPAFYYLFADGDLYYIKMNYKKMPFSEFKENLINKKNVFQLSSVENDYRTSSFVKCISISK